MMGEGVQDTALPLRDIHLPEAISWWPPAPGWWLLLAIMLTGALLVWWWRAHQAAVRVRVVALNEWQRLLVEFQQQQDASRLVRELSILLRRVCLSYYPRTTVAGLTGEAWLRYLDSALPLPQTNPFSEGVGRLLLDAPYQQQTKGDVLALHALCGEWLRALPAVERGCNE